MKFGQIFKLITKKNINIRKLLYKRECTYLVRRENLLNIPKRDRVNLQFSGESPAHCTMEIKRGSGGHSQN